jgi:malonyl-ACP O-methyltransferase BioC
MDKYDENAVVQRIMAEKLVRELLKIRAEFDTVLETGAGTGVLTKELTGKIQYKNYCANDLSEKSKKYLDKILNKYTFIAGNALKINKKADLIISNAMFQWLKDFGCFYNMLEPGGILAFTSFTTGNFREIKELTGLSLEYKSMNEIKQELKDYEILYTKEFEHKMSFQNPLELLAHMKHTGVNSLAHWTFAQVKDFCEKYKRKYPEITLTYTPVIVIARKN